MMSASILPKFIPLEQYYNQLFQDASKKPSMNAFKKWARIGKLPHPTYKLGMDWFVDLTGNIETQEVKPRNKKPLVNSSILSMIMADK